MGHLIHGNPMVLLIMQEVLGSMSNSDEKFAVLLSLQMFSRPVTYYKLDLTGAPDQVRLST
jgi:hypothetical protein